MIKIFGEIDSRAVKHMDLEDLFEPIFEITRINDPWGQQVNHSDIVKNFPKYRRGWIRWSKNKNTKSSQNYQVFWGTDSCSIFYVKQVWEEEIE